MSVPVSERASIGEDERPILAETRLYTAQELLDISADTARRYELKKGKLTIMSPAGSSHGKLALRLGARLQIFVEENGLGTAFAAETGFLLTSDPDTVLAPDTGFVVADRIPADGEPSTYFPGAPDLAVEVVSPGDRAAEVQEKVQTWLTFGASQVWIVEPQSRTVTVYRRDGSVTLLTESDKLGGEDLLPGFSMDLTSLFR